MRLLHTADWHLGRVFYGVSLIEDQREILDQMIAVVEKTQPDAVMIAGDLYDRAVPPPEAVALLDDVLSKIVLGLRVPVFAIAGNHDSPDRTEFLGRLLSEGNLHLQGRLRDHDADPVILMDEHGPVAIHLIPFAEPSAVDELLAREDSAETRTKVGKRRRHHGDALRALLGRAQRNAPAKMRQVVVAHGSVVGGAESESERVLHGGASAFVDASAFAGFSYAALGHFHRPQGFADDTVRYAGSPLAYSFSEEGHQKSMSLVDIDAQGAAHVEEIPLEPRRRLRTVEGTLAELLRAPTSPDFIRARVTDPTPVLDAGGRLRDRFENLVAVEHTRLLDHSRSAPSAQKRQLDDHALLEAFLEEMLPAPLTPAEREAVAKVLENAKDKVRAGATS